MGFLDFLTGRDLVTEEFAAEPLSDLDTALTFALSQLIANDDYIISSVYRATQMLSDLVANLDLELVNRSTGLVEAKTPSLLRTPDPSISGHEFKHLAMQSLLWEGNLFITPLVKDRITGSVLSCYILPSSEVRVSWDARRRYRVYKTREGQVLEPRKDIIHVAMNRKPGELLGTGPVQAARNLLRTARAQELLAASLYEDGATVPVLLKSLDELSPDEAQDLLEAFEAQHSGKARALVTDRSLEVSFPQRNATDLQLAEVMRHTTAQIATLFGIDGDMLNVDSGNSLTYQNLTAMLTDLYQRTLQPTYLARLEEAFNLMVPTQYRVQFNGEKLLRLDEETLARVLSQSAWLTDNEKRARMGLSPIDGGDVLSPVTSPPIASN